MIVVTGAAGFIGSNLVRGLNRAGEDAIIAVDDLSDGGKHRNLNALELADYLDAGELFAVLPKLKGVAAIFHQGACSSTTESDGKYMMANNFTYSKHLAEHALAAGIPFFYASSAAVYGDGQRGFREERACEYPLNVYAYSKLAFDNWVRRRLAAATSPLVGLRYFNVYGPQENHKGEMQSVARKLFCQHRAGERPRLFAGSEELRRDFIHVDDCVAVNLFFLERGGCGIFNVGTGRARSFADVGHICIELLGAREIEFIPMPPALEGRYQRFTEADVGRLRAAGYERPFIGLEEGMRDYYHLLEKTGGYHTPDWQ